MRNLIFIAIALSVNTCYGQTNYVSLIDAAVKEIESRHVLYEFDSLYTERDKDSGIRKQVNLSFKYTDFRWRTLVMVKEIKKEHKDSSVLQYFFKNNQLIKICADVHAGNITTTQQFYFNKGKLVFPGNYRSVFDVTSYIKKSKEYIAFKRRSR